MKKNLCHCRVGGGGGGGAAVWRGRWGRGCSVYGVDGGSEGVGGGGSQLGNWHQPGPGLEGQVTRLGAVW